MRAVRFVWSDEEIAREPREFGRFYKSRQATPGSWCGEALCESSFMQILSRCENAYTTKHTSTLCCLVYVVDDDQTPSRRYICETGRVSFIFCSSSEDAFGRLDVEFRWFLFVKTRYTQRVVLIYKYKASRRTLWLGWFNPQWRFGKWTQLGKH